MINKGLRGSAGTATTQGLHKMILRACKCIFGMIFEK